MIELKKKNENTIQSFPVKLYEIFKILMVFFIKKSQKIKNVSPQNSFIVIIYKNIRKSLPDLIPIKKKPK